MSHANATERPNEHHDKAPVASGQPCETHPALGKQEMRHFVEHEQAQQGVERLEAPIGIEVDRWVFVDTKEHDGLHCVLGDQQCEPGKFLKPVLMQQDAEQAEVQSEAGHP